VYCFSNSCENEVDEELEDGEIVDKDDTVMTRTNETGKNLNEHIRFSSTDIIAPALSNSPR